MKLTERQRRFADEYIICGNASEAARKAGYSEKTAFRSGQENMQKPAIRNYIDERLSELRSEKVADQQEVMEFLTSIMRGEVKEVMPLLDGDGYQKVVEVVPNAQARKAAAELIGKRHAMWTEKSEITQRNIEIRVGEYDDDDND